MTALNTPQRPVPFRKLCFGGSFNPLHIGHLLIARAVAEQQNFGRIVLIPSGNPPHKQPTAELAAAHDRLMMCQLIARDDPLFEVDDLEIRYTGPSYTLQTARHLKAQGWPTIDWLIGADMLQFLPNWHQPLDLLREVTFWIAQRPGFEINWAALPDEYQGLRSQVVSAPLFDVSATEIRRRLRERLPITYLTPPAIERYITDRNLYRH